MYITLLKTKNEIEPDQSNSPDHLQSAIISIHISGPFNCAGCDPPAPIPGVTVFLQVEISPDHAFVASGQAWHEAHAIGF